ncbi:MAG: hypothetical protein U0869_17990 [Chloroflexota bacterium]
MPSTERIVSGVISGPRGSSFVERRRVRPRAGLPDEREPERPPEPPLDFALPRVLVATT